MIHAETLARAAKRSQRAKHSHASVRECPLVGALRLDLEDRDLVPPYRRLVGDSHLVGGLCPQRVRAGLACLHGLGHS